MCQSEVQARKLYTECQRNVLHTVHFELWFLVLETELLIQQNVFHSTEVQSADRLPYPSRGCHVSQRWLCGSHGKADTACCDGGALRADGSFPAGQPRC